MAKLKIKDILEVKADLKDIGEITFKRIPQYISIWWTNRKNRKLIEKTIYSIRKLAFKPWMKNLNKFRVYENFTLPKNEEQVKAQIEYDKCHRHENGHNEEFENRLDKEFAHFDLIKTFQDENGGQDNFGIYLERAIKLNGYKMFPFRKVYTYSKKEKAVCILEEFRPFDNSYNIFVYCTKNHGLKK